MFGKMTSEKCGILGFLLLSLLCSFTHSKNFEEDVVLSTNQKSLLDQFRSRVIGRLTQDYMKEDVHLIKWLRSREFNLDAAETSLMDDLKWRQDNRMDTIHSEDWTDMHKLFKYYLEGRDKFGRSILYFDLANIDVRQAVIKGKGDRLNRYADKVLDEACMLVRTLGKEFKNITRGHLIINVERFSIIQHGCLQCIPFLLKMVYTAENHYPECADQVVVLNTPATTKTLLNTIIPLLSRDTREAVKIYGKDKKNWKAVMSKVFDFDQLPPAIGGTKIYKGMEEDYDYKL